LPYLLVDILVYGEFLPLDVTPYSEEVRVQIELHRKRYEAYKPRRAAPRGGEMGMLLDASVDYERRLASMSTSPEAAVLAESYVNQLRPCYEWEGSSECPKREAEFAATYRKENPAGAFSQYLPLLEAHRWLCTAEGYLRENKPEEAEESRARYQRALLTANGSTSVLVRTAALELSARNSCNQGGQ
jgi:hypothetical protein